MSFSARSRLPLIIVVDDSETVLSVARSILEAAGCRVITHNRAAGCVALILQEKPDLVLIDVNMPGVSGDTIAKLFGKARPDTSTIVLLYSGMPEAALRAKAAGCGAHGYVRKTEDAYEFLRQINGFLKLGTASHPALSSARIRAAARIETTEEPEAPTENRASSPPSSSSAGATSAAYPDRRFSGTMPVANHTVMFIDDDMGTLSGFRRDVQSEPYLVEFALSGAQALRRIFSPSPPSLVVSDILMPSMSGVEIYRQAVAKDKIWEQRFLFVTGAGYAAEVSEFSENFKGLVLTKPVEGQRLRRAIREHLDGLSDTKTHYR